MMSKYKELRLGKEIMPKTLALLNEVVDLWWVDFSYLVFISGFIFTILYEASLQENIILTRAVFLVISS